MPTFTKQQQQFIQQGADKHEQLLERVALGIGTKKLKVQASRHTCITGAAGLGKSFSVQQELKKFKGPNIKLNGAASMPSLARDLALMVYLHLQSKSKDDLVVWIDDCDSIFADADAMNVMKGALDTNDDPAFVWGKDVSRDIERRLNSNIKADQLLAEAMLQFRSEGENNIVGLRIPTDRVRFIITSNHRLATTSDELKTKKQQNESAIARRCSYWHIDLNAQENWGWLATVTLGSKLFELTKAQKEELLSWMWDNWSRIAGKDLSHVKELAATMVNYSDYQRRWSLTLKK